MNTKDAAMERANERSRYMEGRIEFYRTFGNDYADSIAMASMDADDKFGKTNVTLKSNFVGILP